MSQIIFNGSAHQILLIDSSGRTVGTWAAYNNVDSHASLRAVPNGSYGVQDQSASHPHTPSANGPYGMHGIVRFNVPGHPGIGIHSGRANAQRLPGPQHPTMGCIRTSDEAMAAITDTMRSDPLTTVQVVNNPSATASAASPSPEPALELGSRP